MAVRHRINVAVIFEAAGIDPDILSKTDSFLSYDQVAALFEAVTRTTDDPALGLHVGEDSQYQALDVVGHLIATSNDIRGALTELFKFKDLISPYTYFELKEEGDKAILGFWVDEEVSFANNHYYHEMISSSIVTLGRELVGDELDLLEVTFMHPEQPYTSEYERIFKVPITFSSSANHLVMTRASLDVPIATAYPEYHTKVEKLAAEKLHRLLQGESLSIQVEDFIADNIGKANISLDAVASHFNVTARTLQRKLKQENFSFAELRDGLRHKLALKYLKDGTMDIETVAQKLGFSDASNFYHAFKRWEGKSPGEYRKSVLS